MVSEKVKTFLAIQAIAEAISKVVGVDFTEDLGDWYEELENHISIYNSRLTPSSEYFGRPYYLGMPKLDSFKIGRLKPTAKSVKYYKDRMSIALGKSWWEEAIDTLEFETEEKDSLAQQMIDEIQAVKEEEKRPEEASSGQEA